MTDGLLCECPMPLAWWEAGPDRADRDVMTREAALLLTAINQMEASHDQDGGGQDNRRLDRIEAKLDLALHLLARALQPAAAAPARMVRLSAEIVEWEDTRAPEQGTALILELRPSDALPLTLKLPAEALPSTGYLARARFTALPEALDEALVQFVFRRHRQAIRAKAG